MRKIILFIATSLDGYIARTNGGIDWLLHDDNYGYNHFYASVDTIVMGKKTYEQILTLGDYPYQGKINYVVARTPTKAADDNATFIAQNVGEFLRSLRVGAGRDIWLVGGGELVHTCLHEGLIDEIILSIHPILLGAGIPLFIAPFPAKILSLTGCTPFPSGLVQLSYKVL